MNVTIICPGGLKEPFLRDAQQEYVKRLSKCCSLQIVELPPKSIPKPGTPAQIDAALRDEGARILAAVRGGLTAALCVEGEQTDSEGFADIIRRARDSGGGRLNFIIGSSYGLSPEVKKAADVRVSFSKMTFPHQLFRVMLLEQIYRSFDILGAGKYDK